MYEKERWDVPPDIARILDSLGEMEDILSEEPNTCRKGEDIARRIFGENGYFNGEDINAIPCDVPGKCKRVLVVVIGSRTYEDVEKRILQAIEHINVKCPGITRYVIFWALKWDSKAWIKHANSFSNVTVILKSFGAYPTRLR